MRCTFSGLCVTAVKHEKICLNKLNNALVSYRKQYKCDKCMIWKYIIFYNYLKKINFSISFQRIT